MNHPEHVYDVTFPHGTRFRYAFPWFLLLCTLCSILKIYFLLITVAVIFLPMIVISIRSKFKKHEMKIMEKEIAVGPVIIGRDSLHKIEIYKPSIITFYMNKPNDGKRARTETIQIELKDAESICGQLRLWAERNMIKVETVY